ncbi:hypothetical protein BDQ17DRAFT_1345676 [Cyathus striatus]|nr:hypothetical protein BDQ17DRAFT_1345676 [Cyathus striatus]
MDNLYTPSGVSSGTHDGSLLENNSGDHSGAVPTLLSTDSVDKSGINETHSFRGSTTPLGSAGDVSSATHPVEIADINEATSLVEENILPCSYILETTFVLASAFVIPSSTMVFPSTASISSFAFASSSTSSASNIIASLPGVISATHLTAAKTAKTTSLKFLETSTPFASSPTLSSTTTASATSSTELLSQSFTVPTDAPITSTQTMTLLSTGTVTSFPDSAKATSLFMETSTPFASSPTLSSTTTASVISSTELLSQSFTVPTDASSTSTQTKTLFVAGTVTSFPDYDGVDAITAITVTSVITTHRHLTPHPAAINGTQTVGLPVPHLATTTPAFVTPSSTVIPSSSSTAVTNRNHEAEGAVVQRVAVASSVLASLFSMIVLIFIVVPFILRYLRRRAAERHEVRTPSPFTEMENTPNLLRRAWTKLSVRKWDRLPDIEEAVSSSSTPSRALSCEPFARQSSPYATVVSASSFTASDLAGRTRTTMVQSRQPSFLDIDPSLSHYVDSTQPISARSSRSSISRPPSYRSEGRASTFQIVPRT